MVVLILHLLRLTSGNSEKNIHDVINKWGTIIYKIMLIIFIFCKCLKESIRREREVGKEMRKVRSNQNNDNLLIILP